MKPLQRIHRVGATPALIALGFASVAQAAVTVEDSFQTGGGADYTAGTNNLIGQGPTRTGYIGNWVEAYGGAQSPDVNATGLSYTDGVNPMSVAGGSITYAGGGFGRTGRLLVNPYNDTSDGTVYFAVLMQLDSTAASDNYRGFELHSGGFDDGPNRKFQLVTGEPGVGASDANFIVRLFGSASFEADLGAPDTDVNLFVGKIIFSTTNDADQVMIWRNPSDISSENLSGAPDASFSGFNLQFDRTSFARFNNANGITFDEVRFGTTWSDVTTVANSNDTDNDGLPDDWEIANSLDPNDDGSTDFDMGADGDPDIDGSTNLQEFQRGTDPQDEDSDNDNIFDGNETDTGIFVNSSNTGTDPLDPDSDDDGLGDGVETGTGIFVDENDTGTDPNDTDSDNDDVNDKSEIVAGTDPNSAASTPSVANAEVLGVDWFDYPSGDFHDKTGGDYFDNDNSTANDAFVGHIGSQSAWFDSFGDPRIVCGELHTTNAASYRALNGPETGGEAISRFGVVPDAGATTFYFKVDMTYGAGATFAGVSFFADSSENCFFGVLGDGSGNFGVEETGGASSSGDPAVPGQTYTLVGVVGNDGLDDFVKFFIDPDLGSAEPFFGDIELVPNDPNKIFPSAIRLGSGGGGTVVWDNLAVATTWEGLSAIPLDSDTDSLRDAYELAHAGDLTTLTSAAGNNDTDTLTNAQEQDAGTNPLAEDTDGDTLADDVEISNGTNPCLLDTDGDGLNDDWETGTGTYVSGTETGTDPLDTDSDDDTYGDGYEVLLGSDPNVDTDTPATAGTLLCNGFREDLYGSALKVQTVRTEFGDNLSELDAAYAGVQDGKLFVMLTGNIQDNFNKIHILIDSSDAVTSNVLNAAGNDFSDVMDGMTLDTGFTPDFHVIARRGFGGSNDQFDLDFAALGSGQSVQFTNIFGGTKEGFVEATGGSGSLSVLPIGVGYFDDNTAGVLGGTEAADGPAAEAVRTGLELCIDLADLGSPSGTNIKVMAFITSSDHTFSSNQFLGGLPVDLDGAGLGTSNLGTTSAVDLSAIAENQYFEVAVPVQAGDLAITNVTLVGTTFTMTVSGLVPSASYHVEYSPDLSTAFTAVPLSEFVAALATEDVSLTVSGSKGFYRVVEGPIP